jgi:hypothetical protein
MSLPLCKLNTEEIVKAGSRYCCFVNEAITDPETGQFVLCVAVENEAGYYRTELTWGTDFEFAQHNADSLNINLGIAK